MGESLQCVLSKWVLNQPPPKMDGENNGKPYEQMDDFGGKPIFLG